MLLKFIKNINAPTISGRNSKAVLLVHCNQVKIVLELTALTFICATVLAFLMGGAACSSVGASTPLAEDIAIATPLAEAVAALLAEVISAHLLLTSRQVTWPDPFPTTLVHFATYKAKKTILT